jgi:hypothetical protein
MGSSISIGGFRQRIYPPIPEPFGQAKSNPHQGSQVLASLTCENDKFSQFTADRDHGFHCHGNRRIARLFRVWIELDTRAALKRPASAK